MNHFKSFFIQNLFTKTSNFTKNWKSIFLLPEPPTSITEHCFCSEIVYSLLYFLPKVSSPIQWSSQNKTSLLSPIGNCIFLAFNLQDRSYIAPKQALKLFKMRILFLRISGNFGIRLILIFLGINDITLNTFFLSIKIKYNIKKFTIFTYLI